MLQPNIVVVGSNHDYAPVEVREQIAFSGPALDAGLRSLGEHLPEGMILSTCNRTEIYAVSPEGMLAEDEIFSFLQRYHHVPDYLLRGASYVHRGPDAVNHLFRVASGLDSMVLGEPQILSQIRDALAHARDTGIAGPILQRLAIDALKTGKRARTETDIARNRVSIAHAAVELADVEIGGLGGRNVTILGAGKMATLTAKLARARGAATITVVNRSLDRARDLAQAVSGVVVPLSGLSDALGRTDIVFGAAMVEYPLVIPATLSSRDRDIWLVDIAVPRVIDPACGLLPGVHVRDVDALELVAEATRQEYAGEVAKVEHLVSTAVGQFSTWTRSRSGARAIAQLRDRVNAIQAFELDRALRKLTHLSDRDRNVVRALAIGLTSKLVHEPVISLRNANDEEEIARILGVFGIASDKVNPETS